MTTPLPFAPSLNPILRSRRPSAVRTLNLSSQALPSELASQLIPSTEDIRAFFKAEANLSAVAVPAVANLQAEAHLANEQAPEFTQNSLSNPRALLADFVQAVAVPAMAHLSAEAGFPDKAEFTKTRAQDKIDQAVAVPAVDQAVAVPAVAHLPAEAPPKFTKTALFTSEDSADQAVAFPAVTYLPAETLDVAHLPAAHFPAVVGRVGASGATEFNNSVSSLPLGLGLGLGLPFLIVLLIGLFFLCKVI